MKKVKLLDVTFTYPNTRTVNALIRKDILAETDNDSFELSESEAG